MEIGTVEGAVNTEKFKFEAHKDIEKFDFVTVKSNTEEAEWLLAQIDEVEKKPLNDSEKVEGAYKTVASANIIGYRVDGLLKKPRSVIEPDSIVYKADQGTISSTLGLDQNGLRMGVLVTDPDINIYLDPEELYKHIAVLAKTGAGKSYATSVMIEELLEKEYPIVIIDPHGEYHTFSEANETSDENRDKYGIDPKSYPVKQYSPNTELNEEAEQLTFSSTNMDEKEIQAVLPTNLTNSQLGVLYTAMKELKKRDEYDLDDVIDTCMDQDSKAKWNLVNLLETVRDSGMFTDDHTLPEDIIEKGRATIINLRGVDPENQEMTVYKLAKEMFEMRKRGKLEPFIMVIEEAHNFIPEKGMGKAVCSDILSKVASEGRKFGLGLGVISQRPANVAKNILSQCNTQIILRVTNPNDLKAISRSFEGVTSEVQNSITSLPPGVGLVLGKEYPIMTDIRVRRSKHGGTTKDVSEEEGLEKREETIEVDQSLADKAEEEDPDISPGTIDGKDDETGGADKEDEEDVEPRYVESFEASLDFEEIQETLDEPTKAYYPLWIVTTRMGKIAVDAADGEIKDKKLNLTDQAESVLNALKASEHTIPELAEQTGLDESTVSKILQKLIDYSLADKQGKKYTYAGLGIFDHEISEVDVSTDKVIDASISKDEAASIAQDELDTEIEEMQQVYYPYYTSGKRVFDAVLGKEV